MKRYSNLLVYSLMRAIVIGTAGRTDDQEEAAVSHKTKLDAVLPSRPDNSRPESPNRAPLRYVAGAQTASATMSVALAQIDEVLRRLDG